MRRPRVGWRRGRGWNNEVRFDGKDDDGDERDSGGGPEGSASQRPSARDQLSQWNAFRNADAELTYTQMDGEKDEDSPVRPRAVLDTMAS